ncbi:hypothetical protein V8G54_007389 [Vigna mungo]|uniref:Uncharacterized protein n=1 Tax=Vigna mungo TaxID=3915 RepID=A0AAQ3P3Q2_VIGMU
MAAITSEGLLTCLWKFGTIHLSHLYSVFSNEVTLGCSKKNLIKKLALYHMGLRKDEKDWSFKDEHVLEVEEVEPIGVDKSKFVVDQFKKQDDNISKLQESLSGLRRKLDYALRINAFGGTSEDDTTNEEDKHVEIVDNTNSISI